MGILEATSDAFHKHPALVIGALVGVVAIGYVYSRSGSSGAGSTVGAVQYSLGPSDAAIQAGAAIQIAQIQANAASAQTSAQYTAATSIAGTNAAVSMNASNNGVTEDQIAAAVAQSQQSYGYLATVSNNALGAHVSDNETELGITGSNNSAAVQLAQQTTLQAQNTENYSLAQSQAAQAYQVKQNIVADNAALAGSAQSLLQSTNDAYNTEIWSAIQSGQSSQTLDELRAAMATSVTAVNQQVPTSGLWQQFA